MYNPYMMATSYHNYTQGRLRPRLSLQVGMIDSWRFQYSKSLTGMVGTPFLQIKSFKAKGNWCLVVKAFNLPHYGFHDLGSLWEVWGRRHRR
ncbi:hypothetical protein [Moraxella lacunata]|uniref:hypothetical protein n=1 Tax=Moraxella lacunata TaxID=477 RepID=UPI003EDFD873